LVRNVTANLRNIAHDTSVGDLHAVGAAAAVPPLCVALDGVLIRSDLSLESLFASLRADSSLIFRIPFLVARGRAALKAGLAERSAIDPSRLPYNKSVVAFIRQQRMRRRRVVLASASHRRLAEPVARYLGLFDAVEATDGDINLEAEKMAERLVARFGDRGFDYIGNAAGDRAVWRRAHQAYVVGRKRRIDKRVAGNPPIHLFAASPTLRDVIEVLRIYQWVKNLLIFAVLIANNAFTDLDGCTKAGLAFLAFGLCASSAYLLNDLLDLQFDRLHSRKRERPFASGRLPPTLGLGLAVLLLLVAAIIAAFLPWFFAIVLATYFMTTSAYSLWLKRKVLVDVFVLASLYTLRVIAGAAAAAILPSFWLLAFSMFLFLSLAMVKRYAELNDCRDDSGAAAPGRGYNFADLEVLASLGASSAFTAVLVLALYINSDSVMPTYRLPQAIWLLCPLLLYWLSRLWILARRHRLDDDPIVFAAGDWVSRTVVALSAAVFLVAYFGLPSNFK